MGRFKICRVMAWSLLFCLLLLFIALLGMRCSTGVVVAAGAVLGAGSKTLSQFGIAGVVDFCKSLKIHFGFYSQLLC